MGTVNPVIIGNATLHLEDCRQVMANMPADSVDAIVTDPPYGFGFMGKGWDHCVPGVEFWLAALRVAKPGAHCLAFGGTRTFHRIMAAIEDTGWELRDTLMWVYGSGFPKSLDVSKAIDKAAGVEREVTQNGSRKLYEDAGKFTTLTSALRERRDVPASAKAAKWQGWGTALKPAWEPIILARKPIVGTVAANVQAFGTGALNIAACRVDWASQDDKAAAAAAAAAEQRSRQTDRNFEGWGMKAQNLTAEDFAKNTGRWPANLIHDGSEEVLAAFPQAPGQQRSVGPEHGVKDSVNTFGDYGTRETFNPRGDTGSAARFFYTAKASRFDRNEDLHGMAAKPLNWSSGEQSPGTFQSENTNRQAQNYHPTVKPTDLMRYLCRLVTPPGGTVLDPFMGSGSTGKATEREGFLFIGIELDPGYFAIACERIENAQRQARMFA